MRRALAHLLRHMRRFGPDQRGGLAVTMAMTVPVTMFAAGMTIEYAHVTMQKSRLQQIADSAALASARELRMGNTNTGTVQATATNIVQASLAGAAAQGQTQATVNVLNGGSAVEIVLNRMVPALFSPLVTNGATAVSARAVAKLAGGAPLCVLALETSSVTAVDASGSAKLSGSGCAIVSNSPASNGISIRQQAAINAGVICSAGGAYKDPGTQATPTPTTDCARQDDPLSGRAVASGSGPCINQSKYENGTFTLSPGRYCNGISIEGHATVHLTEGTYFIESGTLTVKDGSMLDGAKVAFVFGDTARLNIESDSSDVRLSAPVTGDLAGILLYDKTHASGGIKTHAIKSSKVRKLLGTIYLPSSRLSFSGNASIAEESAFTIILAGQIQLSNGPNLVVNSDYSATDVPVPSGTGPSAVILAN